MLCSPPGVFWSEGSFSSSKRTWRSCGPELMLNVRPARLVDLRLDGRHPLGEFRRELSQPPHVDRDAGPLHPCQDRDQRPFEIGVEVPEALGADLGGQDLLDPPGGVGVLAGVLRDLRHIDLVHPELVLSLADQGRDRDHLVAEQPLGELVEAVVPLAALEQVTQDHRVGHGTVQLGAGPRQGQHVVLEILADLLHGRIGQDRPQGFERRGEVEHASTGRPAHGQIIGLAGLPGEREADQVRPERIERGRLGVDAEPRLPSQFLEERGEQLRRIDQPVLGHPGWAGIGRLRRLGAKAQLVAEPVEPALGADRQQGLAVGRLRLQRIPVERQREIVAKAHERPGPAGRLGVIAQALLLLRPLDPFDLVQEPVERAELLDQGRGVHLADQRDARDVVHGVAGQGEEVDDLVRADSPILLEGRGVHLLLRPQIEQADLIADQLARVLVGRDDEDVQPSLLGPTGQGRDHVVGLHPLLDQDRNPEPLEHPADHGDLRHEVRRHLRAVGLVFRIDLGTEDPARTIEGRRQVVRLATLEDVQQVPEDPEDGVGRLPGRAGHLGDRVEDLEDQRVGIQDVEARTALRRSGLAPGRFGL